MEAANHIAKESFQCSQCTLKENYHYFGRQLPFNNKVKFKESCYVLKDPFTLPSKNQFLILGSNCSICSNAVCHSSECSIFFTKRFCNNCVRNNLDGFPTQISTKILKKQS